MISVKLNPNLLLSQTKTGLLFDEPIEKYHSVRAIGSSLLRSFLKSKMRFAHDWVYGKTESTEALILGSALHAYVLEPELFKQKYAVGPEEVDRRTKAGKEAWTKYLEDNKGKTLLSFEDWKTIENMALNLKKNKLVLELLSDAQVEKSARFKLNNGLIVQCRPDALKRDAIIDLKTCQDVSRFRWDIKSHGYHIQAAFYWFLLSKACPEEYGNADFYFVAVDKTPVKEPCVFGIRNEDLRKVCDEIVKPALKELAEFLKSNNLSDYCNSQSEPLWVSCF